MKTTIDTLLDSLEWKPEPKPEVSNNSDLPFVTHSGLLRLNGVQLKVYQLSSGERVIDADDLQELFGSE